MIELNKVYNMDCFDGLKLMDDNSVDIVVTDPPYFIENLKKDMSDVTIRGSSKNSIFFNEFDHFENLDAFKDFIRNLLLEIRRVLKPMKQAYMFCSYHHLDWMITMIKELDFRFYKPLIWYKPDTMGVFPNQYGCNYEVMLWFRKKGEGQYVNNIGCSQRDVFTHNSTKLSDRKDAGFHPTPKPKALIRQLIVNGTNENDVVLDPFMGSGTTAVSAKETKRQFIGFEINKEYHDVIYKRLAQQSLTNLWEVIQNDANRTDQTSNER